MLDNTCKNRKIEISDSETYADVYKKFYNLLNAGMSVEEITLRLTHQFNDTINDPFEENNFWFALAKAQWECKQLYPIYYNGIKQIVELGSDLQVWKKLGANEAELEERDANLRRFLKELSV